MSYGRLERTLTRSPASFHREIPLHALGLRHASASPLTAVSAVNAMRSTATSRSVHRATQVVLRRLRVGGVLLLFPGMMPRFGEPSAILFADITCPQSNRMVAAAPKTPAPVATPTARGTAPATTTTVQTPTRAKARSFFSLSFREMWEGRAQTLPEEDRVPAPAPVATRTGDHPRS